jgi:hypothetical protein
MSSKLTLSVAPEVVAAAKRYAAAKRHLGLAAGGGLPQRHHAAGSPGW